MKLTLPILHPSIRISVFAWSISRTFLYLLSWAATGLGFTGGSATEAGFGITSAVSERLVAEPPAPMLFDWVRDVFGWMNLLVPSSGTWALLIFSELLMLGGTAGVYTYARKHTLPQGAERATWLWAFGGWLVAAPAGTSWQLAIGCAAVAFGLSVRGHGYLTALFGMVAVAVRPETMLMAPLLILETWASRIKADERGPMSVTVGLPLSFVATVFATILWGDGAKGLDMGTSWRTDWSGAALWDLLVTPSVEWAIVGLVVAALVLQVMWMSRVPRRVLWGIPLMLLPLVLNPMGGGLGILGVALPMYVTGSMATENPEWERPILMGSVLFVMAIAFSSGVR